MRALVDAIIELLYKCVSSGFRIVSLILNMNNIHEIETESSFHSGVTVNVSKTNKLAIDRSICILTRPVLGLTGHYWSIGGQLVD